MAETKTVQARSGPRAMASYAFAAVVSITDDSTDYAVVFRQADGTSLSDDDGWINVGAYAFCALKGAAVTEDAALTVEYRVHPDAPAQDLTLQNATLTAGSGITDVLGEEASGEDITGVAQLRVLTDLTTDSDTDLYLYLST